MAVGGGGVEALFWVPPVTPGNTADWIAPGVLGNGGAPASGTVVSVGLALPSSVFTISDSPVTTSGTLTGNFITQSSNTTFAGPATGADAIPAFRALVIADLPNNIPNSKLANSAITLNAGSGVGLTAPGSMTLGTTNAIGATTDTIRFASLGLGVAAPSSGILNLLTGIQINGAATSANYLRGNGTNFVSSAIQSGDLPGSFSGFGNPTNPGVNLTGSNGVATTAMRSDAVLVIDQTPAYAFTGLGSTNLLAASTLGWGGDLFLTRSAAARIQLGLADAAAPTAQTLRTQGVVTGTSNTAGQNFTIDVSPGTGTGAGGSFIVRTANVGGAGNTQNTLASRFTVAADGSGTLSSGNIQFNQNGAITASALQSANIVGLGNGSGQLIVGGSGGISLQSNTPLRAPSSAVLQLGSNDAASPVAQTLRAQGSRAGTDTNIGGANLTIFPGTGTGTGAISSLILQAPVAVASGTGAQTQTTGLTIKAGAAVLTSYTVATLPAAATAGAGATAFVTDASTTIILGLGLAVVGGGANKVPVYSDGTSWIIG